MSTPYLQRHAQRCARCPALIAWGRTDAGKAMPVNLEPDPAGNVAVYVDGAGVIRARVVSHDLPLATFEHLHVPHFATCGQGSRPPARKDNVVPLYRKREQRRLEQQGTLL